MSEWVDWVRERAKQSSENERGIVAQKRACDQCFRYDGVAVHFLLSTLCTALPVQSSVLYGVAVVSPRNLYLSKISNQHSTLGVLGVRPVEKTDDCEENTRTHTHDLHIFSRLECLLP